jgi:tetratricopeptide (TPR) repeat protein
MKTLSGPGHGSVAQGRLPGHLISWKRRILQSSIIPPATQPRLNGGTPPGQVTLPPDVEAAENFYQTALTLAAMGESDAAIDRLRQATHLDPAKAPAWRLLGDLLSAANDVAGAREAYAARRAALASGHFRHMTPAPLTAEQIGNAEHKWAERLQDKTEEEAEAILRAYLGGPAPLGVVAMRRLAHLVPQEKCRDMLLQRAISLAPDYMQARREYAAVLLGQVRYAEALPHFEHVVAHEPDNVLCRAFLAVCLFHVGEYDKAIELFEECGEAFDAAPLTLLSYSDALKYVGRSDDAVTILRICVEANPGDGKAWWSLANIKTAPFTEADMATMRAQLETADLDPEGRYLIHYALGRALEQARDYAASFQHYAKGAALRRKELSYNDAVLPVMAQRRKAVFTPAFLARTTGIGHPDPAPIFILGLPRAGSTLIEQVLATHSQVEGTAELPEISHIVRDIGVADGGFRYPQCLADMDAEALADLGKRYIERTRIYRKTEKPFFIDKMPSNWAHVGLIHLILPNAKIIDARRQPIANCFAVFKQYFGGGVKYNCDFGELARYYASYLDMMKQFDRLLPGRIHRVYYESMVNDTEAEIRRLLDACGLAFEPACLRFWESKRAVATPSAEQVRQPIFREGLDQWRHYEPWLGPLKQALALEQAKLA